MEFFCQNGSRHREGKKQKFIREEKILDAIKIANVTAVFRKINWLIKDGKAIVQGIVDKQIFFVVEGDLLRHRERTFLQ